MSFCVIYSVVLENHSVQNSPGGRGVYKHPRSTIIKELSGTSAASEPLNFFVSVIYDL